MGFYGFIYARRLHDEYQCNDNIPVRIFFNKAHVDAPVYNDETNKIEFRLGSLPVQTAYMPCIAARGDIGYAEVMHDQTKERQYDRVINVVGRDGRGVCARIDDIAYIKENLGPDCDGMADRPGSVHMIDGRILTVRSFDEFLDQIDGGPSYRNEIGLGGSAFQPRRPDCRAMWR